MLNPRWHKILGDLVENKTRTGLVVMALALGVFTFGLVGNAQFIIDHEIADGLAAAHPADITLILSPFDEDLIRAVEGMLTRLPRPLRSRLAHRVLRRFVHMIRLVAVKV